MIDSCAIVRTHRSLPSLLLDKVLLKCSETYQDLDVGAAKSILLAPKGSSCGLLQPHSVAPSPLLLHSPWPPLTCLTVPLLCHLEELLWMQWYQGQPLVWLTSPGSLGDVCVPSLLPSVPQQWPLVCCLTVYFSPVCLRGVQLSAVWSWEDRVAMSVCDQVTS